MQQPDKKGKQHINNIAAVRLFMRPPPFRYQPPLSASRGFVIPSTGILL